MKRVYDGGTIISGVTFFIGTEVEHTPAYGMRTLFVVGTPPVVEIIDILDTNAGFKDTSKNINHVYFGANQSFKLGGADDHDTWTRWKQMIKTCLDAGVWCTLDVDIKEVEGLVESGLCEYRRFIPMISAKLPYISLLNHNATIKIDDKGFESSNPGVWCHRVHDLTGTNGFTDWDEYTNDEVVK